MTGYRTNKDICILLPAYNPNVKLTELTENLTEYTIFIVDDGSTNSFNFNCFNRNCNVIHHSQNLGKGAALKTGFNAVLKYETKFTTVITADSDGQHSADDIIKISDKAAKNPNSVILGCRNFSVGDIPLKSYLGNKVTRMILKMSYNIDIKDTQTGLRAYPCNILNNLLTISGNGYEYETSVLFRLHKHKINVIEQDIQTIYFNKNKNSHYKPIRDSIKILKEIIYADYKE